MSAATVKEYRGIRNLVYAPVTKDNNSTNTGEGYVTGTVKPLAPVAKLVKDTQSNSEKHFYDNVAGVTINSAVSDDVTISTSAIPLDVLADITGQHYSATKGMLVEGDREEKYFAIGYVTKTTDGTEVFVWRLKGTFNIPGSEHNTEDEGTDGNGQELVFSGVKTAHIFTECGDGARAVNVDTAVNTGVSEATFFASVQTPDTVTAVTNTTTV